MEIKKGRSSDLRIHIGDYLKSVRTEDVGYIFTYHDEIRYALIPYKELIRLQEVEKKYLSRKEQ